jgi:hypothetical protein
LPLRRKGSTGSMCRARAASVSPCAMAAVPASTRTPPGLLCAMGARLSSCTKGITPAIGSCWRLRRRMQWIIGLTIVNATWRSGCATMSSITMNTSGGPRILTHTGIGPTRQTMVGSGDRMRLLSILTQIGHRIVMDVGRGWHHTVGRGSDTSHGAGLLIIMDAGYFITTIGPGLHEVNTIVIGAGGVRL